MSDILDTKPFSNYKIELKLYVKNTLFINETMHSNYINTFSSTTTTENNYDNDDNENYDDDDDDDNDFDFNEENDTKVNGDNTKVNGGNTKVKGGNSKVKSNTKVKNKYGRLCCHGRYYYYCSICKGPGICKHKIRRSVCNICPNKSDKKLFNKKKKK